jgi:hypothetical protein
MSSAMSLLRSLAFLGAALCASSSAGAAEVWRSFGDPTLGYHIEVPAQFSPTTDPETGHLLLRSGNTTIEVYGGVNAHGLSARQFASALRKAGGIADVTYQAGGRTWLVLSGHYQPMRGDPEAMIYYAKFSFSPDLSRLAGFEMSYPASEKLRLDAVVAHIQKTFKGPVQ